MKTINDSYIAVAATKDMQEICKPLTQVLGINGFAFHKIYPDGHEICLSTDAIWIKHLHQNNLTVAADLWAFGVESFKTILWPFIPQKNLQPGSLRDVRDMWDCQFGFSVSNGKDEFFGFTVKHVKDIIIVNHFINNIEHLERFSQYFREKAQPLIEAASEDMLLHFEKPLTKKQNPFQEADIKAKFIAATPITSYRTHTGYVKELKFTLREIDCLRLFIRGYTAAEVATALAISQRTAETHLENIKNKAGVANKNDLIKFIFSNNINKFF